MVTDHHPSVIGGSEAWAKIASKLWTDEGHAVDFFCDADLPSNQLTKLTAPQQVAQLFNARKQHYDTVVAAPHYAAFVEHPNVIAFFHGTYLHYGLDLYPSVF